MQILGDYKILKEIGRGSLGTTYMAEHRFLRKNFALKMLPPELSRDIAFIKRFETEIHNMADLDHPNIVKIHNISCTEGIYYLIADLILDDVGQPTNLAQYLNGRTKRLTEEELVAILKQIASALDAIHDHSLYHGGVKLNNLLMGKREEGIPHVYLSDTALLPIVGAGKVLSRTYLSVADSLSVSMGPLDGGAYAFSEPKEIDKLHLWHRSFLQSYAFLSPEQKLSVKKGEVSKGADVYAFGVLAYFLLTGEFPEGIFPVPALWSELLTSCLAQHVENRPTRLAPLFQQQRYKELGEVLEEIKPKIEPLPFTPPPVPISAPAQAPTPAPTVVQKTRADYMQTAFTRFEQTKPTVILEEPLTEKKPVFNSSELKKPEYEDNPGAIFQSEATVERYVPKKKEVANIEPILTDMVIIEAGEYYRGCDIGARDEKPRHKVFLSSFALDVHPVTNEQFVRFLEVMGGEKDANNNDIIQLKESRIKRLGGKPIIESGYAKHPVVGISWYGAVAYAKWIGKRLPTEAEWEIAASSGLVDNIYPYGMDMERSQANFFSADTTPVKSYPPNEIGLFDMAGNVYEWCQDWYDYNFYETSMQEPTNPKGPVQGVYRVLRGGCWKSLKEDLRCSHRHRNNPGTVNRTSGFRLAADVT